MRSLRRASLVLAFVPALLLPASPAGACTSSSVRIAGRDRIETAIEVSRRVWPVERAVGTAVVARSEDFADALTAGVLAMRFQGTVLLTPRDRLDVRVRDELRRALRDDATIYLLGGTGALSESVEADLQALGHPTERVAGKDRYETAVAAARLGPQMFRTVLADGGTFADAEIAAPIAAAFRAPLLLTDGDRMPEATQEYLESYPSGMNLAVGAPAAAAAPDASHIVGGDRYDTSVVAARTIYGGRGGSLDTDGSQDPQALVVATGLDWPDALTAAALLAWNGSGPLLLTRPARLEPGAASYVAERAHTLERVVVLGGEDVVSRQAQDDLDEVLTSRCA
jgi:putative cell wall-binding protein